MAVIFAKLPDCQDACSTTDGDGGDARAERPAAGSSWRVARLNAWAGLPQPGNRLRLGIRAGRLPRSSGPSSRASVTAGRSCRNAGKATGSVPEFPRAGVAGPVRRPIAAADDRASGRKDAPIRAVLSCGRATRRCSRARPRRRSQTPRADSRGS